MDYGPEQHFNMQSYVNPPGTGCTGPLLIIVVFSSQRMQTDFQKYKEKHIPCICEIGGQGWEDM